MENLISDSLRNFSSRLGELDVAVNTPLDLLSKSDALAEKHKNLENKVVNMEIEVLNLEEKYKHLVRFCLPFICEVPVLPFGTQRFTEESARFLTILSKLI